MENTTKKRAGFVTFWLWLGIIANIITPIVSVINYQGFRNLGNYAMQLIIAGVDVSSFPSEVGIYVTALQAFTIIASVLLIIAYSQLLKWNKRGFYIFIVVTVLNAIANPLLLKGISSVWMKYGLLLNINTMLLIVSPLVSVLILWAILQIKKDGVSCWKQLEPSKSDKVKE